MTLSWLSTNHFWARRSTRPRPSKPRASHPTCAARPRRAASATSSAVRFGTWPITAPEAGLRTSIIGPIEPPRQRRDYWLLAPNNRVGRWTRRTMDTPWPGWSASDVVDLAAVSAFARDTLAPLVAAPEIVLPSDELPRLLADRHDIWAGEDA